MHQANTIWADQQKGHGPFNGVLFIFNLGCDNWTQEMIPREYEAGLCEAIANAHADGWMTLYVFDRMKGTSLPPEGLEFFEQMDFVRLSTALGLDSASFPLDPDARRVALSRMFHDFLERNADEFVAVGRGAAMGLCLVGGDKVLMPFCEVRI